MSRVVIVTGGGTGIGLAAALRFTAAGDQVVLVGRRAAILNQAAKQVNEQETTLPAVAIAADLSEVDQVERLRDQVAERFGRVDVLVLAAGGSAEGRAGNDIPSGLAGSAWRWTANFKLNVLTAVLPIEAFKELLTDNARVLMISSLAAFRGSGSGSYAGAKAALHPYAVDLARELGERGITVNVIAPGYIAGTDFFGDRMTAEREQSLIRQTLTRQAGTAADIAATVQWLASPDAGHVTAQTVQVTGGA